MREIDSYDQLDTLVRGFLPARVILTAVHIDIFTKIGSRKIGAQELSYENLWNERGTTILLDALCSLGLIKKNKSLYSNTPFTNSYLRRDKKSFKGWGTLHRNTMWLGWSNLTEIVTNKPFERPSNLHNKEFNLYFINAMHQFHYEEGLAIAKLLKIEKVEKMIDLAGGPGSYSIAFAQKNKKLKAAIADLPNTLEIAKEKIREFGLEDRITTMECDLYAQSLNLGNDYDLALISNLFHAEGEKENIALLKKTYPLLKKGGRVVVNEIHIDDTKTKPVEGALFSINMLVQTERGNTYPQSQIMRWLKDTGYKPKVINKNLTAGIKE
jgi:3-hydroxy-5-methyl-1-naphthoate 3-O-methyltransferase